jgi:hypothetical protein
MAAAVVAVGSATTSTKSITDCLIVVQPCVSYQDFQSPKWQRERSLCHFLRKKTPQALWAKGH